MKDTLCLHKHFSPSPRAMNSKFKILSMFIILCNHLSPDTAHTHDVYYLFCAEKATLSLLISIYLSVYGLFTPVCCVVWKVLYKRAELCLHLQSTAQQLYCTLVLHWETAKQSVVRFRIGHICGFSCILPFSCMTPGTNINITVHQTCDNHPIMQFAVCAWFMVFDVWTYRDMGPRSGVCWW